MEFILALTNIALDGLEQVIQSRSSKKDKVHYVRYADDFIVTGATKEVLERKIIPAIRSFLKKRGLQLSEEKTKITSIDQGFDFLGFNIRKYKGKLLTKPSKERVKTFLGQIRRTIKKMAAAKTECLIQNLNLKIIGWANYYRHAAAKKTFQKVDSAVFEAIWRWVRRRHPNKSRKWMAGNYFRHQGLRHWIFFTNTSEKNGSPQRVDLAYASDIAIRRHIKIRANASPYDPAFDEYFDLRKRSRKIKREFVGNVAALMECY